MFLFSIRKKSRQLMLKTLIGTAVFLFLLALFLQMTSRFTGIQKSIDYVFMAALGFLFISILFRIVFKTSVDAGYIGFEGQDLFLMPRNKQSRIDIPNEKIEQMVFKPGHSAGDYPPVAFLLGALGLFLGSYDGDDSVLLVRSEFGLAQYNVKFETASQMEVFVNLLEKHPKAVLLQ